MGAERESLAKSFISYLVVLNNNWLSGGNWARSRHQQLIQNRTYIEKYLIINMFLLFLLFLYDYKNLTSTSWSYSLGVQLKYGTEPFFFYLRSNFLPTIMALCDFSLHARKSRIISFRDCELCWEQRIELFLLFGKAIWSIWRWMGRCLLLNRDAYRWN